MADVQAAAATSSRSGLCGELFHDAFLIPWSPSAPLRVCVGLQLQADSGVRYNRVTLHIHHAASSDTPPSSVQRLYPKGAMVSFPGLSAKDFSNRLVHREPGTFPFLTVKVPSMLQVLSFFPPTVMVTFQSMDSSQLKDQGNYHFRQKNYDGAVQLYGMCIDKLVASGDPAIDAKSLVLAYCNRAQCFLLLGRWIEAYDDCIKALELDPHHGKSSFRLGKALHHMQEYSLACDVLEKTGERNCPENTGGVVAEQLEKSRTFLAQSTLGNYGEFLQKYLTSAESCKAGHNAPECSEYLEPVAIRLTPDGKGRGLFATKDLKAGSLVLVSNAMAMARWKNSKDTFRSLQGDVVTELVQRCMRSKADLQRLDTLPDSSQSKRTDVPSMSLFGPNQAARAGVEPPQGHAIIRDCQLEDVDAERIERIFLTTGYASDGEHRSDLARALIGADLFCGLWLLPSFINHSCFSNLSQIDVGRAAFFHATRDINAGDELTVSYIDAHDSWALYRRQRCSQFGFECHCKRCAVEAAYDEKIKHISSVYTENMVYNSFIDPGAQRFLAGLAPQIEAVIQDASDEEKYIIQTAYIAAYVSYYMEIRSSAGSSILIHEGEVPPPASLARALRFCVPGHYKTICRLRDELYVPLEVSDFCSWIGSDCGQNEQTGLELLRRMEAGTWPWQIRMNKQMAQHGLRN
ncbi:hypothetical protein GOP47_0017040 [Adiantum capillus-veneris]|uniref:SET domain-containing protein n=1 Tax=Adiantum capillus-veneris TaxID=13818 RepID=A0A9D4ZCQ0_ADICA|nr:hypothetical protein GOP47_0017040 [Adiantum capillus-veneris]